MTGSDGRYRFPSLPPGTYTVTATLAGFGRVQKSATVRLDRRRPCVMQLSLDDKEAVTVTGEAPLVDTTSTTAGTNYSAKVIEKLPLGRNYADDRPLASRASRRTTARRRAASLALSIYGATSVENQFLIDGVNTTNVIKGFQGKDINSEFIQEVEVKTGGYQAEYGRNTGGVINVITKSGGNEFHGDVFGYYDTFGLARGPEDHRRDGLLPGHAHSTATTGPTPAWTSAAASSRTGSGSSPPTTACPSRRPSRDTTTAPTGP